MRPSLWLKTLAGLSFVCKARFLPIASLWLGMTVTQNIFQRPVRCCPRRSRTPGRGKRHLLKLMVLILAGAFLGAVSLFTKPSALSEYAVKAAYLYNFGKFIQWPASVEAVKGPFTICVLGEDPFGQDLNAVIAGQTVDGRRVTILRNLTPQETGGCRILFINSSEGNALEDILTALDGKGVLTVSDMPGFLARGGIIHFVTENRRVHFEVNLAAAKRAGLRLSSQLLKLAVKVEEGFFSPPSNKKDA